MSLRPLKPHKGSFALYVTLLVASIALMVMIRQCSTPALGERPDNPAGGDTLNVAIEVSPMGVTMSGDTLSGVYYNLLRRVFARHGQEAVFVPFTQVDDALEGLKKGRYQLVVSDIPATSQMKDQYIFLDPVGVDRQVLVQLPDTSGRLAVASQFDLAGQEVWLPKGSPFAPRLHSLGREIGDTIFVREDEDYSSEQLVILTAVGELPRVVVSETLARKMLPHYPNLDASVEISLRQFLSWAVADSTLASRLNLWLKEEQK